MWDEHWDSLNSILREKKKRDAPKATFRLNAAHLVLRRRLQLIADFRRSHEQLSTVIVRVLRASTKTRSAKSEAATPVGQLFSYISMSYYLAFSAATAPKVDFADSNAGDEVHRAYEEIVRRVDVLDLSKDGEAALEAAIKRCVRCTTFSM